ncbi:hypothetical protein, partial [Chryseobacterium sp. CH25]|uniref:hypothetical protein n=1 Tax=Chryseobacterium sp. CH25 TaxID=713559 RepID=UPI0013E9403B
RKKIASRNLVLKNTNQRLPVCNRAPKWRNGYRNAGNISTKKDCQQKSGIEKHQPEITCLQQSS